MRTQYSIDAATGNLTDDNVLPTPGIPGTLTADPSGRFLYVVNLQLQLEIYSINSNTGALTLSSTMTLGSGQIVPTQLLVTP